jgi:hypothetical protein
MLRAAGLSDTDTTELALQLVMKGGKVYVNNS